MVKSMREQEIDKRISMLKNITFSKTGNQEKGLTIFVRVKDVLRNSDWSLLWEKLHYINKKLNILEAKSADGSVEVGRNFKLVLDLSENKNKIIDGRGCNFDSIEELILPDNLERIMGNSFNDLIYLKKLKMNFKLKVLPTCFKNCGKFYEIIYNKKIFINYKRHSIICIDGENFSSKDSNLSK